MLSVEPAKRVYLVGAGISVDEPSGVAGVPDLLELIFTKTQVRGGPTRDVYWRAATIPPAHNPFGALRFEAVIQALAEVAPEVRRLLPLMCAHGEPNACHYFLASELAKGATVLTTNFDRHIESACERQDVECQPYVLSGRHSAPSAEDRFVKLHGTFGGGAAPRATLLAIGRVGLGFDRFPLLRTWLEERAQGCELIVIGYSASDHFDVVPLIEEAARPKSVFWMDYDRCADAVAIQRCTSACSATVPMREGLEFPSVVLGALASRKEPVEAWRVKANSAVAFIRALLPGYEVDLKTEKEGAAARARNLKTLKQRFSKLQLSAWQRREFAKMILEEDPYGGYLGSDFERGSLEEGAAKGTPIFEAAERDVARFGLEGAKARLAKQADRPMTPTQRGDHTAKWFYFATEGEDDAAAFEAAKALVESEVERGVYSAFRADELLLMMLEDVFDGASLRRNTHVMAKIVRHVRAMFRRTGQVGAGVQALLMDARLKHRQLLSSSAGAKTRARWVEEGMESSRRALYFAIRTGRDDMIEPAVWLHAFFLETAGAPQEGLAVLENYVGWIAEEASETRGVTLTNMALVAARLEDFSAVDSYLTRLNAIADDAWPARPLFHAVAQAQINAKQGNKDRARSWIETARVLIDEVSPEDTWRHREELSFLEAQLGAD
jgi:hypothetical protein